MRYSVEAFVGCCLALGATTLSAQSVPGSTFRSLGAGTAFLGTGTQARDYPKSGFSLEAGVGRQYLDRLAGEVDFDATYFRVPTHEQQEILFISAVPCPPNANCVAPPIVTPASASNEVHSFALAVRGIYSAGPRESGGVLTAGAGLRHLVPHLIGDAYVDAFGEVGTGVTVPLGGKRAVSIELRYQRAVSRSSLGGWMMPLAAHVRF